MPIVINEFEVVVDPPPSQPRGADEPAQGEQAQAMRPDEMITVMQVHEARVQRVRAD
jgi:hypothetical protein